MAWQFYGFMEPNGSYRGNYDLTGPLPCKHWVKSPNDKRHKMNYRTPRQIRKPARNKEAYRATAIEYCRWLAKRDGVDVVTTSAMRGIALWSGNHISAVQFWCGTVEVAIINIPNFNWEPQEPVETVDRPGDRLVEWLDYALAA